MTSRKKISIKYLKCWFWVDLFAFIPFSLFFKNLNNINQNLKFIKLAKVFNLIHLIRGIKLLKNACKQELKKRLSRIYLTQKTGKEIFYLQILWNILAIHLMSCLIYYIPVEFSPESNWVIRRELLNKSVFEKYLFSLHFVVETFITVGYGEVPIK